MLFKTPSIVFLTFLCIAFLPNGDCGALLKETSQKFEDAGAAEIIAKVRGNVLPTAKDERTFPIEFHAIYPGTKWCGKGNISESYSDLGIFPEADKCCRTHDYCPQQIEAGKEEHGLKNNGLFTMSHCDCDQQFYNCLKNVPSDGDGAVAHHIGYAYFTLLGPKCFREDYSQTICLKRNLWKCERYIKDPESTNSEKKYQWFDNPMFFKAPFRVLSPL